MSSDRLKFSNLSKIIKAKAFLSFAYNDYTFANKTSGPSSLFKSLTEISLLFFIFSAKDR